MNLCDLIFPRDLYCNSCGRPLPPQGRDGIALCESCTDEIQWVTGRSCAKCGKPLSAENPMDFCRDCSADAHTFGRGYACALYTGRAAGIVREMKYGSRAWYADTLSKVMAARYLSLADIETGELPSYDGLVAVPMAAGKKAVRGFDHAALLAGGFSRHTGIPLHSGMLVRVRETGVMSSLSENERRQNLTGAFAVGCGMMKYTAGKILLMVDDVYTTGSTADACAEALLAAGAKQADLIVFATGADVRRTKDRPAVVESLGQLRAKGPT